MDAHERATAMARLSQITIELEFPKLKQSQSAALELERAKLQSALAQDAVDKSHIDGAAPG
jgi:hypothetical protein